MSELDLMTFPLHGRRLIEASAGTGKTYSITALHLRALLGPLLPNGRAEPIGIDRILVMTFTEAATDSLRERVRARIAAAREALASNVDAPSGDGFVDALRPQLRDRAQAERLLRAATTLVDTASIHTLHGFCMRALREQAFASGAPFAQLFNVDDSAQVRIASTDAWRMLVRHPDAVIAGLMLVRWPRPDQLLGDIRPVLTRSDVELRGIPAGGFPAAVRHASQQLEALRAHLQAPGVIDALEHKSSGLSRDSGKLALASPHMLAAIRQWTAGGAPPFTERNIDLARIVRTCAAPTMGKGKRSDVVDALLPVARPVAAALDALLVAALANALQHTRERLQRDKREQGWIAPDDLLRDMLSALEGPTGAHFAALLRARYPIAMVDEFQDTDSVQWRILEEIYPHTATGDTAAPACILIGDPKQSIYGFRGADVYSYLRAAKSVDGDSRRELRRSFRASPALVNAFNRVYAGRDGFGMQDIAYREVESGLADRAGRPVSFTNPDGALPALEFQLWPTPASAKDLPSRGKLLVYMARATAWQVRALLDGGTCIDGAPLRPGDIAVLVRNWREGKLVRDALRALGLDAGFQSQDSVFGSDTAHDLRAALQAALVPEDEACLRAFLLTVLGGMTAAELVACPLESVAWQRIADRFRGPLATLHEHGVLAWMRQWLRVARAAARLRLRDDGRRRLTDLRHLCELLEGEWRRTRSVVQVADWLDARIDAATRELEETRLMRLDSDDGLVTIRTLHGAKGLEYGVVFLPFQWTGRSNDMPVLHEPLPAPEVGYRAYVDLSGADAEAVRRARIEEDLRLLYVGLTRAKRACYVGIAQAKPWGRQLTLADTALWHLLFAGHNTGNDGSTQTLLDALAVLAHDTPEIAARVLPPEAGAAPPPRAEASPARQVLAAVDPVVLPFTATIPDHWRISSYTSIVAGRHALEPAPGVADEDLAGIDEAMDDHADAASADAAGEGAATTHASRAAAPEAQPFHLRFPRGPAAGSLLHDVLERWDEDSDRRLRVEALVRTHGFGRADIDVDALMAWMARVRELPLAVLEHAGEVPSLASLRLHAEVEFALPLRGGDAAALDAVLQRHGYAHEPLGHQRWHGLLKGFMDVVFEWRGRYVVLDYKSNHLGFDDAAYAPPSLQQAMREHRYDLQMLIYAVALRRWLRVRGVPDARPEGLYWFLRGIDAPGAGVWHHVPEVAVLDALDAVFDGRHHVGPAGMDAA